MSQLEFEVITYNRRQLWESGCVQLTIDFAICLSLAEKVNLSINHRMKYSKTKANAKLSTLIQPLYCHGMIDKYLIIT